MKVYCNHSHEMTLIKTKKEQGVSYYYFRCDEDHDFKVKVFFYFYDRLNLRVDCNCNHLMFESYPKINPMNFYCKNCFNIIRVIND